MIRCSMSLLAAAITVAACSGTSNPTGPAASHAAAPQAGAAGFITSAPAQAIALLPQAELTPIISVGDPIPGMEQNADPDLRVWAPAPDGLGAYLANGRLILYANHELTAGGVDGRFTYSRVSRLELDPATRSVLNGSYPVTGSLLLERLCSATWADGQEGLASGYFFTGEETTSGANGGTSLAVGGDGSITPLGALGRFNHENTVVVPGFEGGTIVTMGMDDSNGKSELYMYVASSTADLLAGNGTLYVFASDGATHSGNLAPGQTIDGRFLPISPSDISASELQDAADNVGDHGAFPFVRLEDADYDRAAYRSGTAPALYFVDTGSGSTTGRVAGRVNASCGGVCDHYGSIYRMEFDQADPTQHARLTLLARSRGVAAGDWASPDNIATSTTSLMLQEDPAYSEFNRAPRIWNFVRQGNGSLGAARAVAKLTNDDCVDADGTCWESSGIIDASEWLGAGTWIFDVQAHTLAVPSAGLSEDGGQLLVLRLPGS